MMLRYSFGLEKEAVAIETAIEELLADGWRTGDILGTSDATPLSCTEMTAKILEYIK